MTKWNVYNKETGAFIATIEYAGKRPTGAKHVAAYKLGLSYKAITIKKAAL